MQAGLRPLTHDAYIPVKLTSVVFRTETSGYFVPGPRHFHEQADAPKTCTLSEFKICIALEVHMAELSVVGPNVLHSLKDQTRFAVSQLERRDGNSGGGGGRELVYFWPIKK